MSSEQNDLFDLEEFLSMVVELLTLNGDAMEVSLLVSGEVTIEEVENTSYGHTEHYIQIQVPSAVYLSLSERDKSNISNTISHFANEVRIREDIWFHGAILRPILKPRSNWRADAISWLRGEGINNQGKVRSDNIASRQHDGLLFRSTPEINLYLALKERGIMFAPLPVFLRGGKGYQRIEPDFVLLWNGIVMVVEVDGDTIHRESPAEADRRTDNFKYEGAIIQHVFASECQTYEKAKHCAVKLLSNLERVKESR